MFQTNLFFYENFLIGNQKKKKKKSLPTSRKWFWLWSSMALLRERLHFFIQPMIPSVSIIQSYRNTSQTGKLSMPSVPSFLQCPFITGQRGNPISSHNQWLSGPGLVAGIHWWRNPREAEKQTSKQLCLTQVLSTRLWKQERGPMTT